MKKHRLLAAASGLVLVAASLVAFATPASAQLPAYCFPPAVGNVNNGAVWIARPANTPTGTHGRARWEEHGEILTVTDTESNGMRIHVRLLNCLTGQFRFFDSGPNEGPTDIERYNLSYAEGIRFAMWACEGGPTTRCGSRVMVNS